MFQCFSFYFCVPLPGIQNWILHESYSAILSPSHLWRHTQCAKRSSLVQLRRIACLVQYNFQRQTAMQAVRDRFNQTDRAVNLKNIHPILFVFKVFSWLIFCGDKLYNAETRLSDYRRLVKFAFSWSRPFNHGLLTTSTDNLTCFNRQDLKMYGKSCSSLMRISLSMFPKDLQAPFLF